MSLETHCGDWGALSWLWIKPWAAINGYGWTPNWAIKRQHLLTRAINTGNAHWHCAVCAWSVLHYWAGGGGKIKKQFGGEAEQNICVCKWIAESTEVRKNRRNRWKRYRGNLQIPVFCSAVLGVLRGWVAKREGETPSACLPQGNLQLLCRPPVPFSIPPFLSLSPGLRRLDSLLLNRWITCGWRLEPKQG